MSAVSFFAAGNVPENNIPKDGRATPGLIARADDLAGIPNQGIPDRYFGGTPSNEHVDSISFIYLGSGGTHVTLDLSADMDAAGESNLLWVFRVGSTIYKFRITDISPDDSTDPYTGIVSALTAVLPSDTEFALVDANDPNVDEANNQFLTDGQSSPVALDLGGTAHAVRSSTALELIVGLNVALDLGGTSHAVRSSSAGGAGTPVEWGDGTPVEWGDGTPVEWGDDRGGDTALELIVGLNVVLDLGGTSHAVRSSTAIALTVELAGNVNLNLGGLTHDVRGGGDQIEVVGANVNLDLGGLTHVVRSSAPLALTVFLPYRVQTTIPVDVALSVEFAVGFAVDFDAQVVFSAEVNVGAYPLEPDPIDPDIQFEAAIAYPYELDQIVFAPEISFAGALSAERQTLGYKIRIRGVDVKSRGYILVAKTLEIEDAVAERPTAGYQLIAPVGVSLDGNGLQPDDFDECTIDYPDTPYRAAVVGTVHYWRFDEAPSTQARGTGRTPVNWMYGDIDNTRWRGYTYAKAAVPYGAAPRFNNTTGAGLNGVNWPDVGTTWAIGGFFLVQGGAVGTRRILRVTGRMTLSCVVSSGTITLSLSVGSHTITTTVTADIWYHVVVTHTGGRTFLWVDGTKVAERNTGAQNYNGIATEMVVADGTNQAKTALDEWALWDAIPNVPDINARRRYHRRFGGYIYGLTDQATPGDATRYYQIPCAGYSWLLDHRFIRALFRSETGDTIRSIFSQVLRLAGLDNRFSTDGITTSATVSRALYPVSSVMEIARDLEQRTGGVLVIDAWRDVSIVNRSDVDPVDDYVLDATTIKHVAKITYPRLFANRVILIGAAQSGIKTDSFQTDGVATQWDLSYQPDEVESLTLNDVFQVWEGDERQWDIDSELGVLKRRPGQTVPAASAVDNLFITYRTAETIVATKDNLESQQSLGLIIEKRIEDETADTIGLANSKASAYLDRHDTPAVGYEVLLKQGLTDVNPRPGTAPLCTFPKHPIDGLRLLIESVKTRSGGRGQGEIKLLRLTAQDHQGLGGDYWRSLARPKRRPAVRVSLAQDPDQIIIRADSSVPARLPLNLGGEWLEYLGPVTDDGWVEPRGAARVRINGHVYSDLKLAWTFIARYEARNNIPANANVSFRLFDVTNDVFVSDPVQVVQEIKTPYTLRDISLPLKEFTLTWKYRIIGAATGDHGRMALSRLDLDFEEI